MKIINVNELYNDKKLLTRVKTLTNGWVIPLDGKVVLIDNRVYHLKSWMNLFSIEVITLSKMNTGHIIKILSTIISWILDLHKRKTVLNNSGFAVCVYATSEIEIPVNFAKRTIAETIFGDEYKGVEYKKILKFTEDTSDCLDFIEN